MTMTDEAYIACADNGEVIVTEKELYSMVDVLITLDRIFDEVQAKDPNSIALKQYLTFKMGAGKTLKSILISTSVRLTVFNMKQIENLTKEDDIDLDKELTSLREREEELKSDANKLQNPDYIARYAREKYLYSKEGEIILFTFRDKFYYIFELC